MPKKKLDQVVYELIIQKIETEELLQKEHVTEQEVADETGVSRTPVRRAFERLVEEDYLEYIENVGVRVKNRNLTSKEFQERIDFIERLINHYLFDLEKDEVDFDTTDLERVILQMSHVIDEDTNDFEQKQIEYWNAILAYSTNIYSKKNVLRTIQELLSDQGYIQQILIDSRSLVVEHFNILLSYLDEKDYKFARREIRILLNQLKLNVIEIGQNYK